MYEQLSQGRARPSLRPVLFAVFASFLLGAGVIGYLSWKGYFAEAESSAVAPARVSASPAPALPMPSPSASETASVASVERVAETQGGLDQRLAAAEQRITRLDLQAQAASGNIARAEALLIAFAARRAIERGSDLGYLGDQLRLRFGDAQPNSVATIIEFSRNPVTLDVLLARLDGLSPRLASSSRQGGFTRFRNEISSLFVIRRETTPSPQPSRRLERARLFLESGRIDKAIGEVERLPGAPHAAAWLADARRFQNARNALDLLETAAVQEPRLLRDGAGQMVEQPSPAEGSLDR